jgi:hypothetical protein
MKSSELINVPANLYGRFVIWLLKRHLNRDAWVLTKRGRGVNRRAWRKARKEQLRFQKATSTDSPRRFFPYGVPNWLAGRWAVYAAPRKPKTKGHILPHILQRQVAVGARDAEEIERVVASASIERNHGS